MRKHLLLAAAAVAAITANAEVINYDFDTTPEHCAWVFDPEGGAFDGNYDFIDKEGKTANTDGDFMNVKDIDGNWTAVQNRCVSLTDGQTYALEADGELDPIDPSHPFICWNQDGKGPTRVVLMKGWNKTEVYEPDIDYGAASADDFIIGKNALGFLRNANTEVRQDTYIQFPAVANPTKLTVWLGNQGGNHHESGLYAVITPVVNGEALDPIGVGLDDGAYVAKRYYKFDVPLPAGLSGNVAFRVGSGKKEGATAGSQVQIYNVQIESGSADAGVEGILDDAADVNAPVYNMMGVKVDSSYKGVVIKNGKKYVQK